MYSQNKELYVYNKRALHGYKKQVDHLFSVPFLNSNETARILIHVELENNDQEERLLKSLSDPCRVDEILISVTKSQGQSFHEVMQQISQIPSS